MGDGQVSTDFGCIVYVMNLLKIAHITKVCGDKYKVSI